MTAILTIHPVNTLQAGYLTKVLDVVSDYCQPILTGGDSNQYIELTNSQALGCKCMTYFDIIANPIFYYRKDLKVFLNDLRFSKMLLDIFAMYSPISKFCNRNLGCKDFVLGRLQNMCPNTTAMMEKLNPCVRVNNKTFHSWLIIKVYLTIKRSPIVAMLHHLIILFALGILRPDAFHLKKFCQSIVFRNGFFLLNRHSQLICQPLAITLRE